jgi:hypothetical protein
MSHHHWHGGFLTIRASDRPRRHSEVPAPGANAVHQIEADLSCRSDPQTTVPKSLPIPAVRAIASAPSRVIKDGMLIDLGAPDDLLAFQQAAE